MTRVQILGAELIIIVTAADHGVGEGRELEEFDSCGGGIVTGDDVTEGGDHDGELLIVREEAAGGRRWRRRRRIRGGELRRRRFPLLLSLGRHLHVLCCSVFSVGDDCCEVDLFLYLCSTQK